MAVQTIVETDSEWADFARASRDIYLALQQEHEIGVRRAGSLYLASTDTERAVLEEFAQTYAANYHCDYLSASEALRALSLYPAKLLPGALHFSDDLTLEPRRCSSSLFPHSSKRA